MPTPVFTQGEVLLAHLIFSDGRAEKRRPVLVVHDFGDADLLVVPITSHPARVESDVPVAHWQEAGLKLPSTVRTEKLATLGKSCVLRKLGVLHPADLAPVRAAWVSIFRNIVP